MYIMKAVFHTWIWVMKTKPIVSLMPLGEEHFPLMLKWLNVPHVKRWYSSGIEWTLQQVQEKYTDYTKGFSLLQGKAIRIDAFVFTADKTPVGYIQYYNAYDFPRDGYEFQKLPQSLGAVDLFLGEAACFGKGLGHKALMLLLKKHVFLRFDYAFVDPDTRNLPAIKMYEKAGFQKCHIDFGQWVCPMMKAKTLFSSEPDQAHSSSYVVI